MWENRQERREVMPTPQQRPELIDRHQVIFIKPVEETGIVYYYYEDNNQIYIHYNYIILIVVGIECFLIM